MNPYPRGIAIIEITNEEVRANSAETSINCVLRGGVLRTKGLLRIQADPMKKSRKEIVQKITVFLAL